MGLERCGGKLLAAGRYRLIATGALARVCGVSSSVLSYYESRLPGVRAIATENGGRAYRRSDAIVLAGIVAELADGASLSELLQHVSAGRTEPIAARGRMLVDAAFPNNPDDAVDPARPVPRDAIVHSRGARRRSVSAAPPDTDANAILKRLAECVQILQRAR